MNIWTLQMRPGTGWKWKSIIQCEDRERLERRGKSLEMETRIVLLPRNPERVTTNRRGVRQRAGVKQWKAKQ